MTGARFASVFAQREVSASPSPEALARSPFLKIGEGLERAAFSARPEKSFCRSPASLAALPRIIFQGAT